MMSVRKFSWLAGAVAGALLAVAGCETVGGEGSAGVEVYGDYGAVDYPAPWYGGGVVIANPPYDRGYRAEDRGHAPAGGGRARSAPSIPNQARPSAGPARGGGAPAGGGGASRGGGGGGGGNDRRR